MTLPAFEPFPSIPRLFREVIITEKLDGTNSTVHVADDGTVSAGSRNRWITPEADNFGFARWVQDHAEELRLLLGPGLHHGEWWGSGIQRRYGLKEKRFSLSNTSRWTDDTPPPPCCHVVPVLGRGQLDTDHVRIALAGLQAYGSTAAPGFMQPEGVVVFHVPSRSFFKATLGGDGHKSGGEDADHRETPP